MEAMVRQTNRIRRGALVLAGVVALWATACIGFKRPDVIVRDVRLGTLGFNGGTLLVNVSVRNPNGFELRTEGLTYDIQLHDTSNGQDRWVEFAQGDFPETIRVDGHDSTSVSIPVKFAYAGVSGALQQVMQTGAFDYRISGDVSLTKPVSRSIPFRKSGTVLVGQ